MLIARPETHGFIEVEKLKDKVQLLQGMKDLTLAGAAMGRGAACLTRFRQRLRAIAPDRITVMGTQALREASNGNDYALELSEILGVPVQVISGEQEAQLIYSAVYYRTGWMPQAKVVLDIGGGSTEIAIGDKLESDHQLSVGIGCVNLMDRFFASDETFSAQLRHATDYATQRLDDALAANQSLGHALSEALQQGALSFGTSGTVESILTVLQANGWVDQEITPEAVARLNNALTDERWLIDAGLPGLPPERADIFPAGVAILTACLRVLGIRALRFVGVSLLHGIVYRQLINDDGAAGQDVVSDVREASVARLAAEYSVDLDQAARVRATAMSLYEQSSPWWVDEHDWEFKNLLRWSAQLHGLGRLINSRHYHRHGGYIVKHAQLPGFSDQQRNMLALLIRGHRRSMPEIAFRAFSVEHQRDMLRAVSLLRLAVVLQRSHTDQDVPDVSLKVMENELYLDCGDGWLAEHPLTARELEVEVQQLGRAGMLLHVS